MGERRSREDDRDGELHLHEELVAVQQQRDTHKKAATDLAEAEATLAEKREFYRFLRSQSENEVEFRELLADEAESYAAYLSFKGAAASSVEPSTTISVPNPLSDNTNSDKN